MKGRKEMTLEEKLGLILRIVRVLTPDERQDPILWIHAKTNGGYYSIANLPDGSVSGGGSHVGASIDAVLLDLGKRVKRMSAEHKERGCQYIQKAAEIERKTDGLQEAIEELAKGVYDNRGDE